MRSARLPVKVFGAAPAPSPGLVGRPWRFSMAQPPPRRQRDRRGSDPTPARRRRFAPPCSPTLPFRAGLSHMTEHAEKEGIVPAGSLDFLTHGERSWVSTEDVE